MKNYIASILVFGVIAGCNTTTPAQSTISDSANIASGVNQCTNGNVVIDYNFDTARVNGCDINEKRVTIAISPENKPINPSPWYAFKYYAKQPQQLEVVINYIHGKHRYSPKMSIDGKTWQVVAHKASAKQLRFKIDATARETYIAAQEIVTNAAYDKWLKQLQSDGKGKVSVLGKSTQGRNISMLEASSKGNDEWLVILGRMHPPEVTGALALFPFVDNLVGERGVEFRKRYNILVVPNLNPDGVAHGNWRHNANGVDLNRDWKKFAQVESRLVRDKLQAIVNAGGKIRFAADFHSTYKDVFYTMPSDYGLKPPHFVEKWLERLAKVTPQGFTVFGKPGSNPNKGVFKQYIADTFGVHAITYEMGDNTDRVMIDTVAKDASDTLMAKMLATPASAYGVNNEAK
ncbi:M14 family metallopeptidase [Psychrobium sp. MM17-31]|uniref:M14 family metallopeptidase n=1 Tax=Psychrobium sp. MM17-31 TaxID=2917758 RepID=UPI001EF5CABC|nr:M14 family metallopeptidase [Psychrobium sp. MM17-31]MCG7532152.1 M14 family metallopeptidase [Psychrobium sp. MM17-31]